MNYELGDFLAQLPWYKVPMIHVPAGEEPWGYWPNYLNEYLTYGNHVQSVEKNWGWAEVVKCGGLPHPWALENVSIPQNAFGATGVRLGYYDTNGLGQDGEQLILNRLNNGHPTIVLGSWESPSSGRLIKHSYVIDGIDTTTGEWTVLDPVNRTGTFSTTPRSRVDDKYSTWKNQIYKIVTVDAVSHPVAHLTIDDDPSPIEFAIFDPLGRRSGYDPTTGASQQGIPNAHSWSMGGETSLTDPSEEVDPEHQALTVDDPMDGIWRAEVIGTAAGPFDFSIGSVGVNGQVETASTTNGEIANGQVIKTQISYASGNDPVVTQVTNFTPQPIAGGDRDSNTVRPVRFDGSKSWDADGQVVSWHWDFGDGGSAATPTVSHTYNQAGTYIAQLTVTDDAGATSTASVRVSIRDDTPIANASGPYVAALDQSAGTITVLFDGTRSFSPTGGPLTATWDFGDGSEPLVTNRLDPFHVYRPPPGLTPGAYTVTLSVESESQQSAPVTTFVQVLAAPRGQHGRTEPSCASPGEAYTLRGTALPNSVNGSGWNLADGPLPGWSGFSVSDPFGGRHEIVTSPPDYKLDIPLLVPPGTPPSGIPYTGGGAVGDIFISIRVPCPTPTNLTPLAMAGGPYRAVEGEPVTFDGTQSTDPEGQPLAYDWDFGDDSAASGATPSHAYARPGVYFVALTVSDGGNSSQPSPGESVALVEVAPAKPRCKAAFLPPITQNEDPDDFTLGRVIPIKIRVSECLEADDLKPQVDLVRASDGAQVVPVSVDTAGITIMRSIGNDRYIFNLSTRHSYFVTGALISRGLYSLSVSAVQMETISTRVQLR